MPDTIAAIATAPAAAAVGIVRLSGAETRRVLAALFTPVDGRSAAELPPRRMTYGTVRDAEGRTLGVNLLPPAQRLHQRNPWRLWNIAFGVAGVLALGFALAQVVDNRQAAADALQAEVATRSAQARSVSEQRQRLVDDVEGGRYLQQQRNGRASVIEVIDALSPRLPDGTYLEKLGIEGEQLTLLGLSNQAAALVGKLEGAPQWHSPALSGALQTDPRTRMDRFTLVAQLRGTVAADTSTDKQEAADGAR